MKPDIIKTYYQTVDIDGSEKSWLYGRPTLHIEKHYDSPGEFIGGFLFPIPLKPLQIAEITVNENGTWSYEIEREEGWYMARAKAYNAVYPLQYKGGIWYSGIGNRIDAEPFTISSTRIPDECII